MKRLLPALAFAASAPAFATSPTIEDGLAVIRAAALSRNAQQAASLFADDLALVSQSGKLYGRADAVADLGNGFEQWENSDIVVRRDGSRALVTLVNTRKRPKLEAARFRVLQVWTKSRGGWRIIAQSTTKIAN